VSIFDTIDSFVCQSNTVITQKRRRDRIKIYSEGLKGKIKQVEYSSRKLSEFEHLTDSTRTSTAEDGFPIPESVNFYCDSFWIFLYSSLDVLAQILNQAVKLSLKERDISFKKVNTCIPAKLQGTPVHKKLAACIKSNAFKNLEDYRNCSIHRRQIFILEETKHVTHTPGYQASSTGSVPTVVRTLCDNPLALSPRIKQVRKIPEYLIETQKKILKHIDQILKNTIPLK